MAETAKKSEVEVVKGSEPKKMPSRALLPFEDMERMFDDFFGRGWPRRWRFGRMPELSTALEERLPKLDVVDRDDEVLVRAEVPGVNKEDLEVSINGDLFTIKGKTRHETKEEKGDYYRCEVSQGSFSRTVTLPAPVDEGKASAQLKDGMLEVSLPKIESSKKRAIKIE